MNGMTNQEAIKELSEWLDGCCGGEEIEPTRQALRLAISALQAQEAKTQLSAEGTTSDLISRQAAIDALMEFDKKLRKINWYQYPHTEYECRGVDEAIVKIENLPSAQSEPQWIPVSERLPDVGKDVMVCYDFKGHRSVLIGVLYGDEKFHGYDDEYLTPEGRKYRKAVAWMPLPEPYRAERRTDGRD